MTTSNDPEFRVSYSTVEASRRCSRQYAYQCAGLEKVRLSAAPVVGTWWHAVRAADAVARGRVHGSLLVEPPDIPTPAGPMRVDSPVGQVCAVAEQWQRSLDEADREAVDAKIAGTPSAKGQAGPSLGKYLLHLDARWRQHWAPRLATERPLLVEAECRRAVPRVDGLVLQGRLDEVYFDSTRQMVVLRDHKWHGSWPSESEAVTEVMDGQTHLYAWLVQPLFEQLRESAVGGDAEYPIPDLPTHVTALEHCRTRGKVPTTPQLTKAGKLSKSVTDFDLWTYRRWCATEPKFEGTGRYPVGGTYSEDPDVVARLSDPQEAPEFFRRSLRPVNRNLIRTHLQAAVDEHPRMVRTQRAVFEGREVSPSPGRGCAWCDYLSLCRAEMLGGPVDPDSFDPAEYGLRMRP